MTVCISRIAARYGAGRFTVDTVLLMTGRVITMVISFVSGVIVARALGPENKGALTALLVVPGLIQLFAELGLRQSTVYLLGKRIFDEATVIGTVSLLSFVMSVAGVALVTLSYMAIGLPQIYGWDITAIPLLLIPCNLVVTYGSGVLMAKQKIRTITVISVLENLVTLGLYCLLLITDFLSVQAALWAIVIGALVAAGCTATLVRSYGSIRPQYLPGIPSRFIKMGIVYALALFIINLSYRIDILLLERLSSAREVGIYSVGVGLAQLLWLPSSAIAMVNFAHSAGAADARSYSQRTALILRATLWASILPCFLLYWVAPWLVQGIYGEAYFESGAVVQAIMLGIWIDLIFKILNSDLAGRGMPQAALWVSSIALLANVILNLLWIPSHGSVGAAWASSVSYTIGALVFAYTYAHISRVRFFDLLLPRKAELHMLLAKLPI